MYNSKLLSNPCVKIDKTINAINRKIRHKMTANSKKAMLRRSRDKLIEDLNELSELMR